MASKPTEPKPEIDLHSALRSTLRAWLALRDIALWGFCGGTDFEESGVYIEEIEPSSFTNLSARMNDLLRAAIEIASRIPASGTAHRIVATEMKALLATESPRFSLHLDSIPDSF